MNVCVMKDELVLGGFLKILTERNEDVEFLSNTEDLSDDTFT